VELLKPDHVGGLLTDQQSKRQLASFPLVQQQLSKFIFFDPCKSFVNHGQHEIHEDVEHSRDVRNEEDRVPLGDGVRRHHHIWKIGRCE
jgi:hypothetical protein